MANRDYVLSACDRYGRCDYVIEDQRGTQFFSQLSQVIDILASEMRTRRHHIRVTFRTETLIWYDKPDRELYRARPLTADEQNTVWEELHRHFPQT